MWGFYDKELEGLFKEQQYAVIVPGSSSIESWLREKDIPAVDVLGSDAEYKELKRGKMSGLKFVEWEDSYFGSFINYGIDDLRAEVKELQILEGEQSWREGLEMMSQVGMTRAELVKYINKAVFKRVLEVVDVLMLMDPRCLQELNGRQVYVETRQEDETLNSPDLLLKVGGQAEPKFIVNVAKCDLDTDAEELNFQYETGVQSKAYIAIQETYCCMLVNGVRYGMVTNGRHAVFIKDEIRAKERVVKIPRPMSFQGSASKEFNVIGAAFTLCMVSLGYYAGISHGIATATSYLPVFNEDTFVGMVSFTRRLRTESSVGCVTSGRFKAAGTKKSRRGVEVVVKISHMTRNRKGDKLLKHERFVYERLKEDQGDLLPWILGYGTIMNTCRVLILCNFGRQLNEWELRHHPTDVVRTSQLIEKLHKRRISHNNIHPASFVRWKQNFRLVGFSHATCDTDEFENDWIHYAKMVKEANMNPRIGVGPPTPVRRRYVYSTDNTDPDRQ
ncbi:hypothetical protein TRICI_000128 [Trichomonascus ciferrii]|uniref:Protein kinase domain-containing protein n=1 Tax=Trichomonascus ciferrii TaxID=44093 RepID=A0A642VE71_9ASCO|nr:hypothetical protein TRICI_000128 [Trichomonascus ciferrii]